MIFQAQLQRWLSIGDEIKNLAAEQDLLKTLFKSERRDVEPGRLALTVVDVDSKTTPYKEVLDALIRVHPDLYGETQQLIDAETKPKVQCNIKITAATNA